MNGKRDFVPWDIFREHEAEARKGFERLGSIGVVLEMNRKEFDEMKAENHDAHEKIKQCVDATTTRINKIENKIMLATGGGIVIGVVVADIIAALLRKMIN